MTRINTNEKEKLVKISGISGQKKLGVSAAHNESKNN